MRKVKKIKVLHILPSLVNGGAERLMIDIAKYHDSEKVSLSLLLFKEKGELYPEMEKFNIPVFLFRKRSKIDIKNIWEMYQAIKRERPDIVHTHLGGDIYGRLAARFAGVPIIVSTEHNLNKSEGKLVSFAKRWTANWADTIIAVSQAVKKDAHQRYHIPLKKFKVIYNGIDFSRYTVKALSEKQHSPFIVGAAGRLVEQKGFEYLIKAIKELVDEGRSVQCVIKGDGLLRPYLEDLIKRLDLREIVTLPGIEANMLRFYSTIQVFVVPSIWEGLGLVVLEAGASRVPVIASNVDGLEEIIEEGVNGLLCKPADSTALAEKIKYSMDNPDRAQEMSKNLQKTVKERFSIQRMITEYEDLYQNLIRSYESPAN